MLKMGLVVMMVVMLLLLLLVIVPVMLVVLVVRLLMVLVMLMLKVMLVLQGQFSKCIHATSTRGRRCGGGGGQGWRGGIAACYC